MREERKAGEDVVRKSRLKHWNRRVVKANGPKNPVHSPLAISRAIQYILYFEIRDALSPSTDLPKQASPGLHRTRCCLKAEILQQHYYFRLAHSLSSAPTLVYRRPKFLASRTTAPTPTDDNPPSTQLCTCRPRTSL